MTIAEINDKKTKGLCFHCDEKYFPGHACKKKKLYVMLTEQQTDREDCCEDDKLALIWEDEPGIEGEQKEKESAISLHAITGSKGSHTLKVQGKIKNRVVKILVDSGSTNNFISQGIAKQLQLATSPCTPFQVIVANGEKINCKGSVDSLTWEIAGQLFTSKVNVIPLGGYDLVL